MADKLAIIQSEETIKELDIIDKKTTELVATFKNLYTETERIKRNGGSCEEISFSAKTNSGNTKQS